MTRKNLSIYMLGGGIVLVLVAVEIIQSGYTRKLNAERAALQKHS